MSQSKRVQIHGIKRLFHRQHFSSSSSTNLPLSTNSTTRISQISLKRTENTNRRLTGTNQCTDEGEKFCRICNESSQLSKEQLINPCICKGSIKYIHESCLKMWIEKKKNEKTFKPNCEFCNTEYYLVFIINYLFSKRKTLKTVTQSLLCFLLATIFFSILIYFMVKSQKEADNQSNLKYIFIYVAVSIPLIIIISFLIIKLKNCRNNWYKQNLLQWTILNINGKSNL